MKKMLVLAAIAAILVVTTGCADGPVRAWLRNSMFTSWGKPTCAAPCSLGVHDLHGSYFGDMFHEGFEGPFPGGPIYGTPMPGPMIPGGISPHHIEALPGPQGGN